MDPGLPQMRLRSLRNSITFFCHDESQLEPRGSLRREWDRRSLYPTEVTQLEVLAHLRQLDVCKATGPDGISNYILKSCADELAPVIAICVNKSLDTSSNNTSLQGWIEGTLE